MLAEALTLQDSMGLALSAMLALPILGAIVCALVRGSRDARWIALITSLLCFALSIPLLVNHQSVVPMTVGQIGSINFSFTLGVDSISAWLLALTTFLMPLAIAASFASIQERP